jgi:hypothetical protein
VSKPDWKDAPKWANYIAMDEDGTWWWFENEPHKTGNGWDYGDISRLASAEGLDWQETLERRP